MNDNQCSAVKGKCEKKDIKCLIPVIAVFATLFIFQWLFHGVYMMPAYEATASLWRSKEEMEGLMWVCLSTKLVMAIIISCLYCCMAKGASCNGKCPKTGAKFGLKIGLLLGAHDFASYIWMPIDMNMALKWLTGDMLMGVIIGVVLSYVARMCKKDSKGECTAA